MKKLILTAVTALVSLNLYAADCSDPTGGTVAFQNASGSVVFNNHTGANVVAADGIRVALYWAPLSDPDNFCQIGAMASVGVPIAGRFSGGTRTTGAETPAGTAGWFQVRAWELAYGATFEDAIAAPGQGGRVALRGQSSAFQSATGNPNAQPPIAPVNLATSGLPGFAVDVPEPSVIALGLLGAGALLLLRRRK